MTLLEKRNEKCDICFRDHHQVHRTTRNNKIHALDAIRSSNWFDTFFFLGVEHEHEHTHQKQRIICTKKQTFEATTLFSTTQHTKSTQNYSHSAYFLFQQTEN